MGDFDLAKRRIQHVAYLVEMHIWCIKIGIVLVLHFNPWVEASAGGLEVPEGLYSPVAK
jgi:cbb3-type cytochrome oxidase subunit 1